jgi:LAO/AO transport system kinase
MEIADVFVVNKADRPEADQFVKNLRLMLAPSFSNHAMPVPVVKTIALQKMGIKELWEFVTNIQQQIGHNKLHYWLMAEKAFHLIEKKRMMDVNKEELKNKIEAEGNTFNLYRFIKKYS